MMTIIPSPAPNMVGQPVPEFGSAASVGVGVPAQAQSASATHEAFLQYPW